MTKKTKKQRAWTLFDRIVGEAEEALGTTNPWTVAEGELVYRPSIPTLERLLGVPLLLEADTRSGVPALALDVWLSFELRRAGFDGDATWPRGRHPRVLARDVSALLDRLPTTEKKKLRGRLERPSGVGGVTAASANILGKNYLKQVDVIMSGWQTGPEVLISTKRMDSSYGKNAANRIEEAYGDAKNLRLRHPLAAHGFLMALRSDILQTERTQAAWMEDLMTKLSAEEDAYHATCVLYMDYSASPPPPDNGEDTDETIEGSADADDEGAPEEHSSDRETELALELLPEVTVLQDRPGPKLRVDRFLKTVVEHVLNVTPITLHEKARALRREAIAASGQEPSTLI